MIQGPTLYLLVEPNDHIACRCPTAIIPECCFDLVQKRADVLAGRLEQYLAVGITTHRLPQKVKAVFAMRDAGFLVGEFKTPLGQEMFHERLDFILKQKPRCAGNDEVIRITDQMHPIPFAGAAGGSKALV